MERINGLDILKVVVKSKKFFILIPIVIFIAYSYLFLHDTVGIASFSYFYPVFDLVSASLLTTLITFIISINYYIIKEKKAANKKNTFFAIFFSLLSTPFCCNVLIPLFIAYLFGSAALSPIYFSAQTLLVDSDPLIIVTSIVLIYLFYKRSINSFLKCKIRIKEKAGVARI